MIEKISPGAGWENLPRIHSAVYLAALYPTSTNSFSASLIAFSTEAEPEIIFINILGKSVV